MRLGRNREGPKNLIRPLCCYRAINVTGLATWTSTTGKPSGLPALWASGQLDDKRTRQSVKSGTPFEAWRRCIKLLMRLNSGSVPPARFGEDHACSAVAR